jgi:hypothetical protein
MLCSSTPNTSLPRISRNSASSASRSRRASAKSAALAVSRSFRPSIPDARNAMVGFVCASTRSATISARADSATPHVRSVRLTITWAEPDRRRKSGTTARSIISCISCGTPGTA